jgi:hypothetical protein
MRITGWALILLCLCANVQAQTGRIKDINAIGWYAYTGTFNFHPKVGLHTEYQLRRDNVITRWQQSLLRVGLNYYAHKNATLHVGYGWIETFPYGDYPLAATGVAFTEHRLYEQVNLTHNIDRVFFTHRFRFEQRWLAKLAAGKGREVQGWNYLNRIRYMLRFNIALMGNTIDKKEPYLAAFDEIFIGFGKNIGINIFDQNRLSGLLGFKATDWCSVETGYIFQLLEQGKAVSGNAVFQYNHGLLINLVFNVPVYDYYKKKGE